MSFWCGQNCISVQPTTATADSGCCSCINSWNRVLVHWFSGGGNLTPRAHLTVFGSVVVLCDLGEMLLPSVGRGQGCCYAVHNAQDSPPQGIFYPQMSMVPMLGNLVLGDEEHRAGELVRVKPQWELQWNMSVSGSGPNHTLYSEGYKLIRSPEKYTVFINLYGWGPPKMQQLITISF